MDAFARRRRDKLVMTAVVRFVLPANWRTIAGQNLAGLSCEVDTVGQALQWLGDRYPVFIERIFSIEGELAPWVVVSLDDTDVRTLDGLDSRISADHAELQVIPALMGG